MIKLASLFLFFIPFLSVAQQLVDPDFIPKRVVCYFCELESSPVVAVDSAHYNFHTVEGRYKPFAKVLEADGLTVIDFNKRFSRVSLDAVDILVVANAVNEKNRQNWDLPNFPAFSREEVESVYHWVKNGGALFLIADHMPWPAAMADLAEVFGFGFINGYVEIVGKQEQFFNRQSQSILPTAVTPADGENVVDVIQGFLGQGFTIPPQAQPVLQFTQPSINWMPSKSWSIDDETPSLSANGLYQGAIMEVGKGKVAVFGEAGMFTAQVVKSDDGEYAMGMNSASAKDNQQLLLNIVRWLVSH